MHGINSNFAERLDKLERLNRTTMRLALTALLSTGAVVLVALGRPSTGQTNVSGVQNEVRARKFVLVDEAGHERAELGINPDGRAGLVVWDKAKGMSAWLGTDDREMPVLTFGSKTGEPLMEFGVLDGRSPVFIMRAADGKRRVGLVVTKTGAAGIGVYDAEGRNRGILYMDEAGYPQLTLKDNNGEPRASVIVTSNGTCALTLFDAKGQERIVFQVQAQGEADAAVFARDGKVKWSTGNPVKKGE